MDTSLNALLEPRGIFGGHSSGSSDLSNHSCPWQPPFDETATLPIFGTWTFYHFNIWLSGACAVFTTIVILILQFMHGTHFSQPYQQARIIRIAFLLPSYALFNWFCVFHPQSFYYLNPWLDVVQSLCLVSFFLLINDFIAPSHEQRATFFATAQLNAKKPEKFATPEKRLIWYRRTWVFIFQYPVIALAVAIVTDITQAAQVYCGTSFAPGHAHLWTFLLDNLSVGAAVTSIIAFYGTTKTQLAHRKPLSKLLAFKILVLLGFLQGILFSVLNSLGVMKPNDHLTFADMKVGIPTLVLCIEGVPLSLFFHYAYSYREFKLGHQRIPAKDSQVVERPMATAYYGGFLGWKAYIAAIDPREALFGLVYAFKMGQELQVNGGFRDKSDQM